MTTEPAAEDLAADIPEFPTAIVRDSSQVAHAIGRSSGWLWLIAAACLVTALVLTFRSVGSSGTSITIRFRDGHGLKPEDTLRHRGIDVGNVETVRLREDLGGVEVIVRLRPDAELIAREGSQFWIERPQISLARISGLETVVGAKYVGVVPGAADGPSSTEFDGLDNSPRLQMEPSTTTTIQVSFADGHGIAVGDVVKFRGIVIGEVTDVRLRADLSGVIVEARLTQESKSVARQGSVFWVERAQLSLQGIRGLDTLVGGQYLAVQPGPIDSVPSQEFVGADEAPQSYNPIEGGLSIQLTCAERFGLERGAPITYRGLSAGQVTSVSLTEDSFAVLILATIHPEFSALVRTNTQFWSKSGVDFHIGLRGVDMEVDPLSTLSTGGIAFATPAPAGEPVEPGHHFELAKQESSGWLDWRPNFADIEAAVGRGQRLLNRIRSPFGGGDVDETGADDETGDAN